MVEATGKDLRAGVRQTHPRCPVDRLIARVRLKKWERCAHQPVHHAVAGRIPQEWPGFATGRANERGSGVACAVADRGQHAPLGQR